MIVSNVFHINNMTIVSFTEKINSNIAIGKMFLVNDKEVRVISIPTEDLYSIVTDFDPNISAGDIFMEIV